MPGGGKGGEPNILTRPWQKRRTEDSDYASASEATIDVFSTPLSAPTAVWHHQRIRLPLGLSLLCGSVKTLLHIYSIVQAFKNYHSLLFIAFSIPISNCVKYKKRTRHSNRNLGETIKLLTIPRMQFSEIGPRLRWGRGWSLTQD